MHIDDETLSALGYACPEAGMFLVLCGCLVALAWLVSTAPEGE